MREWPSVLSLGRFRQFLTFWHNFVKLNKVTKLPLQLKRERGQRRQMDEDRMFAAHPFSSFALNATQISYVAPAVGFTVGVDDLSIEAGFGYA